MRPDPLNTCLVFLYFLIMSSASVLPRDKYREIVPSDAKTSPSAITKEPTCDELRAMWRFSKRQSRAAEITNEIPTYRDPFAFNVWEDYARPRSAGRGRIRRPVYGRVIHTVQRPRVPDNTPERIRAFEEVARLFGTPGSVNPSKGIPRRKNTSFRLSGGMGAPIPMQNTQSGSFQHLKELIKSERARELHEQRMTEEAARAAAVKDVVSNIQYGRIVQDQSIPTYNRDDLDYKTGPGRSRTQREGIINFPDVYAPSKYEEELLPSLTFKQRSYPDSAVSK